MTGAVLRRRPGLPALTTLFPNRCFASVYETFTKFRGRNSVELKQQAVESAFLGKKVLLVEDNELNMEIAKSLLEMHGLYCDGEGRGTR